MPPSVTERLLQACDDLELLAYTTPRAARAWVTVRSVLDELTEDDQAYDVWLNTKAIELFGACA